MILVDTSVWIEFLRNREPWFSHVLTLLERQESLGFEPVFGELFQGCKSQRETDVVALLWESIPHTNGADAWIRAGRRSMVEKLIQRGIGIIDSAIWIAAEDADAQIATLDKKLQGVLPAERLYTTD
jgi:predicted nucleic acid-binding protein